ncbi:hypothetical protein [Janthinobacterium sp. P210006]|uniref:hypothetical protein n=1 Tax=Janthinobacterium sp. P210006 TaxID=3112939 RepID=UPI002E25C5CA|nr:hypothetical protein [Janthinobacterium sp. P210006]
MDVAWLAGQPAANTIGQPERIGNELFLPRRQIAAKMSEFPLVAGWLMAMFSFNICFDATSEYRYI